ncbi:MAG: hypothetical protein IJU98_03875, partial [Synergistaceae bacterium]|nr:hypothetical protein [Synergistaceae bacterium]
MFTAKHSALGGRSLAQLWMMTAIGVKKDIVSKLNVSTTCDVAKAAKETVLKGQYGSGAVGSLLSNGYTYNYTAPTWNNSGYVETTLKIGALLGDVTFRVRFSDFGVGVILPGNANHYVSTSIENDTPKGEQAST